VAARTEKGDIRLIGRQGELVRLSAERRRKESGHQVGPGPGRRPKRKNIRRRRKRNMAGPAPKRRRGKRRRKRTRRREINRR
jgi:hypothetical protein